MQHGLWSIDYGPLSMVPSQVVQQNEFHEILKSPPGNAAFSQCNCDLEYSTLNGSIVYQSS